MLVLPSLFIKYYGTDVYGTYQLYLSTFQIMLVCATLDLGHSFFHRWARSESDKEKIWYDLNKVSYLVFSIMSLFSLIITILLDLDKKIIIGGLIYCFILIYYSNILNYDRYTGSIVKHNITKIVQIVLLISIVIIFCLIANQSLVSNTIGNVAVVSLILSYVFTVMFFFKKPIKWNYLTFRDINIKSELKISYPVFLGGLVENVLLNIDKIMIAYLITITDLSYYSINLAIGSIFLLWGKAIDTYFLPDIMRSQSESDVKKRLQVAHSTKVITIRYTVIMFILILVFNSFYSEKIIRLWINAEHANYYYLAIVATVTSLLRILYNLRRHEEYAKYNNWYLLYLNVVILVIALLIIFVAQFFIEVNIIMIAFAFLSAHLLRLLLIFPDIVSYVKLENNDYFNLVLFTLLIIGNKLLFNYLDGSVLAELTLACILGLTFGIINIKAMLQFSSK